MAKDGKLQPIIVKRIKKGAHGHHGGAWKIAYADFVTAMMAFFLLMWLLGSTTEGDRKGIADYFNSPLKVSMLGGSGSGDSSHVIRGGGTDLSRAVGQVKRGDQDAKRETINLHQFRAEQARAERVRLEELKAEVAKRISENPNLATLGAQIKLEMTPEGLRIQIVDEGKPMFASGSAVVQPYMRDLLREIGVALVKVPNRLVFEGHTDSTPYQGGGTGYGNWELSADRANASRRELHAAGLSDERVMRVLGLAASQPLNLSDSTAAINRRISISVLTRDAEERLQKGLGSEIIGGEATQQTAAAAPAPAPAPRPAWVEPVRPAAPTPVPSAATVPVGVAPGRNPG
ncbi:MAG: flagellar motor protein MotB [Rubrivivax sp.]